ncbi:MAG: hypothetical protein B7733_24690 [Myxococcales bacterium FL481]|nr:MAG: hypothetical protein B7733_24690 [Myxococcales bacterium FL481]
MSWALESTQTAVVCLVGRIGVGRSHIAQASGHRAGQGGYDVICASALQILAVLRAASI